MMLSSIFLLHLGTLKCRNPKNILRQCDKLNITFFL